MRTIAGTILILAAAVLFHAGATASSASVHNDPGVYWSFELGAIIGLVGFILCFIGLITDDLKIEA